MMKSLGKPGQVHGRRHPRALGRIRKRTARSGRRAGERDDSVNLVPAGDSASPLGRELFHACPKPCALFAAQVAQHGGTQIALVAGGSAPR